MKIYKLFVLGLIVVSSISCDEKTTEPEVAITVNDFVGTWNATSHMLTNNSNPSETIDLIANGAELRFTALEEGRVRTWFTFGSFSDEWDALVVLTSGNTLTSTPAEATRDVITYEFVLKNDTLELTNRNDSFDFTLSNATEVSATSVTMFVRN